MPNAWRCLAYSTPSSTAFCAAPASAMAVKPSHKSSASEKSRRASVPSARTTTRSPISMSANGNDARFSTGCGCRPQRHHHQPSRRSARPPRPRQLPAGTSPSREPRPGRGMNVTNASPASALRQPLRTRLAALRKQSCGNLSLDDRGGRKRHDRRARRSVRVPAPMRPNLLPLHRPPSRRHRSPATPSTAGRRNPTAQPLAHAREVDSRAYSAANESTSCRCSPDKAQVHVRRSHHMRICLLSDLRVALSAAPSCGRSDDRLVPVHALSSRRRYRGLPRRGARPSSGGDDARVRGTALPKRCRTRRRLRQRARRQGLLRAQLARRVRRTRTAMRGTSRYSTKSSCVSTRRFTCPRPPEWWRRSSARSVPPR